MNAGMGGGGIQDSNNMPHIPKTYLDVSDDLYEQEGEEEF